MATRNLIRLKAGKTVSYYVDGEAYAASTHGKEQCVACHLDFAYKAPHEQDPDWQSTARWHARTVTKSSSSLTAKACTGVPSTPPGAAAAIEKTKPLCGDCHGTTTSSRSPIRLKVRRGCMTTVGRYVAGVTRTTGTTTTTTTTELPTRVAPMTLLRVGHVTDGTKSCRRPTRVSGERSASCRDMRAERLPQSERVGCRLSGLCIRDHGKRAVAEKNPLHRFARNVLGAIGGLFVGD